MQGVRCTPPLHERRNYLRGNANAAGRIADLATRGPVALALSEGQWMWYPSCDDGQAKRPPFGNGAKNVNRTFYACNWCLLLPDFTTQCRILHPSLHNVRDGIKFTPTLQRFAKTLGTPDLDPLCWLLRISVLKKKPLSLHFLVGPPQAANRSYKESGWTPDWNWS